MELRMLCRSLCRWEHRGTNAEHHMILRKLVILSYPSFDPLSSHGEIVGHIVEPLTSEDKEPPIFSPAARRSYVVTLLYRNSKC
jgi:hypothetical protein